MAQQASLQQIAEAIASLAQSIRGQENVVRGANPQVNVGIPAGQIQQIIEAIAFAIRDNPPNVDLSGIARAIRQIDPAITQDQINQLNEPLNIMMGVGGDAANLPSIYRAIMQLRDDEINSLGELNVRLLEILNRLSGQEPGRRGIRGIPVQIMNHVGVLQLKRFF
jgi:hypothetical protein